MIPILAVPAALYAQAPTLAFPESFVWNPETRGPLLVVLPGDEKALQPVTVGSLTSLIPKQRTELRWEKLPEPDLYTGLGDAEKLALLQASLSEKQWERLCSRAGLGLRELGRDQRTLFLGLLPIPLTLQRGSELATLSDTERQQTRLRLSRKFAYSFTNSSGATVAMGGGEVDTVPWQLGPQVIAAPQLRGGLILGGETILQEGRVEFGSSRNIDLSFVTSLTDISGITLSQELNQGFSFIGNGASSGGTFGATFTEPRSNGSKPSQLEYASSLLDARVSLLDIKTVGELVKRCGEATKQELFCDPRHANRAVHLRGISARAGDICHALARSVTGTWRKVGPGYVLTDDVVPLAIRMGRIHDWLTAAQQSLDKAREGADERATAMLAAYLQWSDDDPNRPDGALASRLAQFERDAPEGKKLSLRIRDLPEAVRLRAEQQIVSFQTVNNGDPNRSPINTEKVIYEPQTVLELLPPGHDPVRVHWAANNLRLGRRPEPSELELPQPPKNSPPRILAVAIQNESEARLAVATAKEKGFTALWAHVGLDNTSILKVAIEAGESEGLPVYALVRPLRTTTSTNTELTVEGKHSSIYLRPDAPESRAAILPPLKKLAATPGLAGLILTDLYPTGYQRDGATWDTTLGYSESLRLACLRQQGADPVDLTHAQLKSNQVWLSSYVTLTNFGGPYYSLPSAPWYGPSGALWDVFDTVRQATAEAFADSLLAELKSPAPGFFLARQSRDRRTFAPTQRCLWVPTSPQPNSIGYFLAQWHEAAREKKPPESIVFDASDRPLSQALAVLAKL